MTSSQLSDRLTARALNMYIGNSLAVMPRITLADWWECDVLRVTPNLYTTELEIKVSRSDFLADRAKARQLFGQFRNCEDMLAPAWEVKHLRLANRESAVPNRFCFVMPKGLVREDEVPAWAGIIWAEAEGGWNEVRRAPMLHKRKCDTQLVQDMRETAMWRYCRSEIKRATGRLLPMFGT